MCNPGKSLDFNRILIFDTYVGLWHCAFATYQTISTTAEHLSVSARL